MKYLIEKIDVFEDFEYPFGLQKIVELNLVDFDVWYIMNQETATDRLYGLRERYPRRKLVPFAMRQDCDDIACFDLDNSNKICVIHDYASEGYEQIKMYDSIWDWLREAIDVMIEFECIEEIYR